MAGKRDTAVSRRRSRRARHGVKETSRSESSRPEEESFSVAFPLISAK